MKIDLKDIIFKTSALLVVAGAALPLFVHATWVPYIFAVGAAGMSVIRLPTEATTPACVVLCSLSYWQP